MTEEFLKERYSPSRLCVAIVQAKNNRIVVKKDP